MNPFERLVFLFSKLPGIGPRQARRFAFFTLQSGASFGLELSEVLTKIYQEVSQCPQCFLYFSGVPQLCETCRSGEINQGQMLLVERDVDVEAVKKAGGYKGRFFVLGGVLPFLEKNPKDKIRILELYRELERIKKEANLTEIVFALSATPEGDNTAQYVKKTIEPLLAGVKISRLGRGLSTGTELEYADQITIEDALKTRSNFS